MISDSPGTFAQACAAPSPLGFAADPGVMPKQRSDLPFAVIGSVRGQHPGLPIPGASLHNVHTADRLRGSFEPQEPPALRGGDGEDRADGSESRSDERNDETGACPSAPSGGEAGAAPDVLPLSGFLPQGHVLIDELGDVHVRCTSSSRRRSAAWALFRVAPTVPTAMPSTSAMAA